MKLWAVFRFELRYQARRPWPWVIALALVVLAFLMTRDAALADAVYDDFLANGPFSAAITTVVCGFFWLLAGASIAGDAGARDLATGMAPLTYTAPVSRTEYLGGRFLAALALNAVLLLAIQAGAVLGVYSPGVNPQLVGPFRPEIYLTSYLYIALPNALVATALQFALAVRSGRGMVAFLGSLFLLFLGFFVASILNFLVRPGLGTLVDPVGINLIAEDLAHMWTTTQKSHGLLALEGIILQNRVLWIAIALGILSFTWIRFRFEHRTVTSWWSRFGRRKAQAPTPAGSDAPGARTPIAVPAAPRTFGFQGELRKILAIAGVSFRTIATSWGGRVMLLAVPLMTVLVLLDQMSALGTPLVPRTALILAELTGGLSAGLASEPSRWIVVPLFLLYFAGDLVWRERDAGLNEITDAMPGSEWGPLLGKFLGLSLVTAVFMAMLAVTGILAQTILGYGQLELGLYLKILFGLQLPEYLLCLVLAFAVHVVVNHKYLGHLAAILAYAFIAALAGMLGLEHNLLVYLRGPAWMYTDMRGFAGTVGPWLWFKLYWAAWTVLLAVAARVLWVRGRETGFGVRFRQARRRARLGTAWTAATAVALVLSLGGFIFYNTNIVHDYRSSGEIEERRAEYERRYRQYEGAPQPRLARASLRVEIYPERRKLEVRGTYRLVNRGDQPLESVHLTTATGRGEPEAIRLDRAARLSLHDPDHGYRIYVLERPLQPGDSLALEFELRAEPRGFGNNGRDPSIVANGSYFTNAEWFPAVGYQRFRELLGPASRRKHGLEPRPVLAALSEEGEPAARGGGVMFEAVVGTGPDQVAVAPGALVRSWTEQGRRYYHYATDAPIGDEWAFFSADYAVHEERWNDVVIRVYHSPEHTDHLAGMMRSVRASLDYYSREFDPYPYGHLAVVEHPVGMGAGAHADPAIISHGQGFASWVARDSGRGLDLPYFVMAHEMAHQWTVPYALVEGLPFLAEGLATWSAMEVVRENRSEAQYRRLLRFMRLPFPYQPIRRGEPLLRAVDPYLARRKGPFAMRALGEYLGPDRVRAAIRRLVVAHDSAGAPPATTLDLYRELQAVTPDSLRYLLHDLFEINASWAFSVRRASAVETGDGAWRVTLEVQARKVMYDSAGVVSEMPMDEWIPVAVFGSAEEGQDELSRPLHVGWHRIRSGEQTITVTVPGRPALAGVDPYHVLDWEQGEESDDNVTTVDGSTGGIR